MALGDGIGRNKRKTDYIVERAVHGNSFKDEVIGLLTGQYRITKEDATIAFDNCMAFDCAVVVPINKDYPNGVMIGTDLYRSKVAIG